MSSSNDRYYGTSYSKSRRSSPGESQGVFFQTGQGGRTVLPPISSAFPTSRFPVPTYSNQYTPRSSPARYEVNQQALYNHWPSTTSPEPTSSYPNYETHGRFSTQDYNYSSRTPPIPGAQLDNRKLPPLATNAGAGWTTSYMPMSSNYQSSSGIRSPIASYPTPYIYPSSHGGAYSYHMPTQEHSHMHVPSMNPPPHISSYDGMNSSRSDHHRSSSPYNRHPSQVSPPAYTPPPISPTSGPDESTVKKKRKRADAAQLKILNETYNRTAFPSTEERLALAKMLDMAPRSVQIWFQNKRQSMRQTNRQSSTAGSSSQSYVVGNPDILEDPVQMNYGGPISTEEVSYSSRHSPDAFRSYPSHSSSSLRRVRNQEEANEHRKWSGY